MRICCLPPCWALLCTLFAVFMLTVAVTSPWYFVYNAETLVTQSGDKVSVDIFAVFWWTGLWEQKTTNGGNSDRQTVTWTQFGSDDPRNWYIIVETLASVALIFGVVLVVAFVIVILARYRNGKLRPGVKYFITVVSGLATVCAILSWSLFLHFPTALDNAGDICVVPGQYWCNNFWGHTSDSNAVASYSYQWGPFIGWVAAVISTLPLIVIFGISFYIRTRPNCPTRQSYSSL